MPHTYASMSQGADERWHATLWGICRTLKTTIKHNHNDDVDTTTPLMACIVKHTSWLHNRYQLHGDGQHHMKGGGTTRIKSQFVNLQRESCFATHLVSPIKHRINGTTTFGSEGALRVTSILSLQEIKFTEIAVLGDYTWLIGIRRNYLRRSMQFHGLLVELESQKSPSYYLVDYKGCSVDHYIDIRLTRVTRMMLRNRV